MSDLLGQSDRLARGREWGWERGKASRATRTLQPQLEWSPDWQWLTVCPYDRCDWQRCHGVEVTAFPACSQYSLRATALDSSRPTSPTKSSQINAELNLKQEIWLWKCDSRTILLAPLSFHETVMVPTAPKALFTLKKNGSNLPCTRHLWIFHRIFRYLLRFVFWRSCMSLNLEVY